MFSQLYMKPIKQWPIILKIFPRSMYYLKTPLAVHKLAVALTGPMHLEKVRRVVRQAVIIDR